MNRRPPCHRGLACSPGTTLILRGTPGELAGPDARKILGIATVCADLPIACEAVPAGAPLEARGGGEQGFLPPLPPPSGSMVLVLRDGGSGEEIPVTTSRAMAKAVASMAVAAEEKSRNLMGTSLAEEAVIDGWLNYFWASIDLPFHVLRSLPEGGEEPTATDAPDPSVSQRAAIENDLATALGRVEAHLRSLDRTGATDAGESENDCPEGHRPRYIVPIAGAADGASIEGASRYTLADLCLAVTLHCMVEKKVAVATSATSDQEAFPRLCDWYRNMKAVLALP